MADLVLLSPFHLDHSSFFFTFIGDVAFPLAFTFQSRKIEAGLLRSHWREGKPRSRACSRNFIWETKSEKSRREGRSLIVDCCYVFCSKLIAIDCSVTKIDTISVDRVNWLLCTQKLIAKLIKLIGSLILVDKKWFLTHLFVLLSFFF